MKPYKRVDENEVGLVRFYGLSIHDGYWMPNPVYKLIQYIFVNEYFVSKLLKQAHI